jgi:hypothetical protein
MSVGGVSLAVLATESTRGNYPCQRLDQRPGDPSFASDEPALCIPLCILLSIRINPHKVVMTNSLAAVAIASMLASRRFLDDIRLDPLAG